MIGDCALQLLNVLFFVFTSVDLFSCIYRILIDERYYHRRGMKDKCEGCTDQKYFGKLQLNVDQ